VIAWSIYCPTPIGLFPHVAASSQLVPNHPVPLPSDLTRSCLWERDSPKIIPVSYWHLSTASAVVPIAKVTADLPFCTGAYREAESFGFLSYSFGEA